MTEFITDSIFIKNKYRDFIFLSQAFEWRVSTYKNEATIINKNIHKLDTEYLSFTGVVSPSNYRLQYELLFLNRQTRFYSPENFEKRKPYDVNFKKIEKLFMNYLKRSFISYLSYESLKNLGLKRIEQFLVMMSVAGTQNFKSVDNLVLANNIYTIKSFDFIKDDTISMTGIKLLPFISILNTVYSFSFEELSKFLLKEYSKGNITDPFYKHGFFFLTDTSKEIYDIGRNLEDIKIDISIFKCVITDEQGKDRTIVIKKPKEDISEHLYEYLQLQKEDYFIGKVLKGTSVNNLLLVESMLKDILPFKDIFLTLKLLLKLNKIESKNMFLSIDEELLIKLKPKNNSTWLRKEIWKSIYDSVTFNFSNLINPVDIKEELFTCPICGEGHYSVSPLKLFCGNIKCRFLFLRGNLASFGVKRISVENIIEGLNNKSLLLRTDKNKNISVFLEKKGGTYFFEVR